MKMSKEDALKKIDELKSYVEGLEKTEGWKPKVKESYWCVESDGVIDMFTWLDTEMDLGRLNFKNVFSTAEEAEMHLLRLESMAQRGEEPDAGEDGYIWDFKIRNAYQEIYDRVYYPEFFIGNWHKTKEDCEVWAKKYAEAFLTVGRKE